MCVVITLRIDRLDADLLARLEGLPDEAGVDRDAYVQDALRHHAGEVSNQQ